MLPFLPMVPMAPELEDLRVIADLTTPTLPCADPCDPVFLQGVLDHLRDGVYFVDRSRRITYWNSGAERITGYASAEVVGHCCADNLLNHVDDAGCELCIHDCPLSTAMRNGAVQDARMYLRHRQGHRVPVQVRVAAIHDLSGAVIGAVESFSDGTPLVSSERRVEELRRETMTDPLTGIGNRRMLEVRTTACLAELAVGVSCAAVFIDIDHFKHINDRWGHRVGDEVLRTVGRTLAASVRAGDTVARCGGEEFVVLLPGIDEEELVRKADSLRALIGASTVTGPGGPIRVTVSAGATMAREGESTGDWLARADHALYTAKRRGRNQVTLER